VERRLETFTFYEAALVYLQDTRSLPKQFIRVAEQEHGEFSPYVTLSFKWGRDEVGSLEGEGVEAGWSAHGDEEAARAAGREWVGASGRAGCAVPPPRPGCT
jgi:hypothetical protein